MSKKFKNRVRHHLEPSGNGHESLVTRCRHFTEQTVEQSPVVAALAVFGIGLGLGTIIGSMLASSDTVSAQLRRMSPARRRSWLEAMTGALPESIRSHLHR